MNERRKGKKEGDESDEELEEKWDGFFRDLMGGKVVIVIDPNSECGCPKCVARREKEKLTWN